MVGKLEYMSVELQDRVDPEIDVEDRAGELLTNRIPPLVVAFALLIVTVFN